MGTGEDKVLTREQRIFKKAAERARTDINAFIEFVFQVKQAACHVTIQEHIDLYQRAFILAHKELGKTTQCLGRVLFLLGNNPDLRIKVVCADDDSAADRVMFLRDMIGRNQRLHMVFPNLKRHETVDDWGKKSLTIQRDSFSKDSSVEAAGILTSGTGQRSDVILFDDVCNFQNAIQYPLDREKVKQAFKNVWIPTLGPAGRAVYIANRHHEDDQTSEIEKMPAVWKMLDMSVTGEPPVSPWHERWNTESLQQRETEIGSIEFDRTMRNILHPDAERKIQVAWIRYYNSPGVPRGNLRLMSFDYGASGEKSDFTARAVADVDYEARRIRMLNIDRRQGMTFNEIIEWIIESFKTWTPDLILSEETGFMIVVGHDERIVGQYPMEQIVPVLNKEQRVGQTAVLYERGIVMFANGECDGGIKEITDFPKAKNDDRVDAVTQLLIFGMGKMGKFFAPEQSKASGPRAFTSNAQPSLGMTNKDTYDQEQERPRTVRANFRNVKW